MPNKTFSWKAGWREVRVRVTLCLSATLGHLIMLSEPDTAGDVTFNDAIPLDTWRHINAWVEETLGGLPHG